MSFWGPCSAGVHARFSAARWAPCKSCAHRVRTADTIELSELSKPLCHGGAIPVLAQPQGFRQLKLWQQPIELSSRARPLADGTRLGKGSGMSCLLYTRFGGKRQVSRY